MHLDTYHYKKGYNILPPFLYKVYSFLKKKILKYKVYFIASLI
jgi:hypothetical protein